ncbi:hypothetical protein [Glaciihabitans sp. UYNi722]|uniref:hypothetical protein n=1 Tax=Glaciihabitans sp. UYNi722 TaxID=3156344 RepID=UPI0033963BD7
MLRKGFGAELALPHANDLRYDLAGTVVRSSTGVPRAGLFPPVGTLLTPSATMAVNVAAFSAVAVRDGGVVFLANDGPATVTPAVAPSANSRLDVLYAKQNDASSYVTTPDGDNLAVFGVLQGFASATPVRNPAGLPQGAVELGTILIPSTATNSGSAGVVITSTFQYTAMTGGVVTFRNTTERDAFGTPGDGQLGYLISAGQLIEYIATATTPGWQVIAGRPVVSVVTFAGVYSSSGSSPVSLVQQNGRNYLEGTVVSTSATFVLGTTYTIGTVPAALAPLTPVVFACSANATALGAVQVDASGNVTLVLNSGFTGVLALSLAGSWRAKGL